MANINKARLATFKAGAALTSADANRLVHVTRSGTEGKVVKATDQAHYPVGTFSGDAVAVDGAAGVNLISAGGILPMVANAGVQAGQIAVAAADGKIAGVANAAALTGTGVGVILEDGAANQIVRVAASYVSKS